MIATSALGRGRESFARRARADAYTDLSAADHESPLTSQPGLYFIGQFFLSSLTSSLIGGVGRDAKHIAPRQGSVPNPADQRPSEAV